MNWGYKILTVIILFIAGMGTMLTIAMRQKNELIDDQYYVKELMHQDIINASHNLKQIAASVSLLNKTDAVYLSLPMATCNKEVKGSVEFLRPSDQSRDRTISLKVNASGIQIIPRAYFISGAYTVRISWQNGDLPYYYEENIFIN